MSLYYDAASIFPSATSTGSLKTRIYGSKDLKAAPAQVFALIVETVKYNALLKETIDNAQLLKWERKVKSNSGIECNDQY